MDFVGNIGGDDFIFIVPWEQTELSKILIAIFSIIVFNPFGEEEKAGRDYVAMDWRGWS